jgi:hypothetical protein
VSLDSSGATSPDGLAIHAVAGERRGDVDLDLRLALAERVGADALETPGRRRDVGVAQPDDLRRAQRAERTRAMASPSASVLPSPTAFPARRYQ